MKLRMVGLFSLAFLSPILLSGCFAEKSLDCSLENVICVGKSDDFLFDSIQDAVDLAKEGDTVLVHSGHYKGFVVEDKNGTKDAPITVRAENTGVYLDETIHYKLAGYDAHLENFIRIYRSNFITIDGFNIRGTGSKDYSYVEFACIYVKSGNSSLGDAPYAEGIKIINNEISQCSPAGVYVSNIKDVVIENNYIHHTKVVDIPESSSRYSAWHHSQGQAIYVSNEHTDNALIKNNKIAFNQGPGIHFNGDNEGPQTGHHIEGNFIFANGLTADQNETITEYVRWSGNGLNLDGIQRSVFSNNIIVSNGGSGIKLYRGDTPEGPANNHFMNNLIGFNLNAASRSKHGLGNNVVFNEIYVANARINTPLFDGFSEPAEGFVDNKIAANNIIENVYQGDWLANPVSALELNFADDSTELSADELEEVMLGFKVVDSVQAKDLGYAEFEGVQAPKFDVIAEERNEQPDIGPFEL